MRVCVCESAEKRRVAAIAGAVNGVIHHQSVLRWQWVRVIVCHANIVRNKLLPRICWIHPIEAVVFALTALIVCCYIGVHSCEFW